MGRRALQIAISVGLIGVLLAVCSRLPDLHTATVALLMVLLIVAIAKMWGWRESLVAALAGGLGFDYYFLPPHGFGIENPEHWVDLAAFLLTAIAAGQLVARSKRHRILAEERKNEVEKLYRLTDAIQHSGSSEFTWTQLPKRLVEIFGATGIALYDKRSGQTIRSGPGAGTIPDRALHLAAEASGPQIVQTNAPFSVTPLLHGGELVGSIGMSGAKLSESLFNEVAGQIGLGLARLYAIEKSKDAEVARRSEELKSAALDAMAHEIRNPLNSVKLAASTLLSGHAGGEPEKQEMLTIIDQEASRMDRLIDEAVQIARVQANDFSLTKEPQDLAQLIPAAIEEMHALAGRRAIRVSVPKSLPPADCDGDMIARVLRQLVGNALKYSPEDSPLMVSAEFTGAAIVIDVVDRGPGVDDDERDRIFEKYYRGRAAHSRTPGTGLGLASARSIVQAHGGEIWVTSPPAGGAAFHISLPVIGASHGVGAR